MQIAQLNEFFDIIHYQLKTSAAMVELVAGDMVVKAQYVFLNTGGQQAEPVVNINMVVTPAQSDGLKSALAAILQATNAAIEAETGWTKYTAPSG